MRYQSNEFIVESIGESYPEILQRLLARGTYVLSRAGGTVNLKDAKIVLLDPERSLAGRKGMSDEFADEEATQLLAGMFDADRLGAILPRAAEMITPTTAYGPRTAGQLLLAEEELRRNPGTRRAVVYVGRSNDLLLSGEASRAGEMPCTCLWQFDLSEGALDMFVYMRSNDAVWGFTYDVPSFTAVQRAMARALGVPLGVYIHHAGSFHVYERHFAIDTWRRTEDRLALDWLGGSIFETQDRAVARISA